MKDYLAPGILFFLFAHVTFAHNVQAPATIEHFPLEKVSQHIYVVHGSQELPSAQTRGFMKNPAAILTNNGVIIVDPGSSKEIGKQLLKKVRKLSAKPVIAIFNTHVHGDHWLGNHGIREEYPIVPIYAHDKMISRVKTGEGQDWLKLLMNMTKGAVAGTKAIMPNIGLKGGEQLELDGITLKIHHTGPAHTDHDIMIEVVNDKGLFFGDIVSSNRVPNSDVPHDANFKGSITAIKTMINDNIKVYIPGHGHSGGQEVPKASLDFLETLYASVTRYFNQGLADYEMKEKVENDLQAYKDWHNFNEIGRVINFTYQEVERENF
jgi:glyoxylase-like metal-dependent hydrolase (beta-lactamase superfamily II)